MPPGLPACASAWSPFTRRPCVAAAHAGPIQGDNASVVKGIADGAGASPAQIAVAWTLRRFARSPTAYIPILGARSGAELRELLAARDIAVTDAQFEDISKAGAPNLGEPHNHNALSMDFIGGGPYYRPLYPAA